MVTVSIVWIVLACSSPVESTLPDVLLVTLDTTRADALGVYGTDPSPSPTIDALAARGLAVDEAMTVTPLTLPAHSSIITGLYPDAHGVRDNMSFRLDADAATLAEALREAGYATGAFVSAAVLDHAFGLDQGFDTYSDTVRGGTRRSPGVPRRPAEEVVTEAGDWIASLNRDRPLLAWVHLYDAHRPYTPPEPYRSMFPGDDGYLASIAYLDAQLGTLLDRVQALGRDPLVVVVGDHGEGRGDHGELTHGWFVYRSTMRIPLVISGPGVPVRRLTGPASVVDIVPTVLGLLDVPAPSALDGVSLMPVLRGEADLDPARALYGETWSPRFSYGFAELRVVQDGTNRYIEAPAPELYAWTADPHESNNLVTSHPNTDELQRLREAVHVLVDRDAEVPHGTVGPADPDMVEMLAQLGYVAAAPIAGSSIEPLPDPKSRPDMIELYDAVMISARTRPPAEAIPLLDQFVKEFPRVAPARLLLGRASLLAGQPDHGLDALAPLLAGERPDPQAQLLQAQLHLAAGQADEGFSVLRALQTTWPAWTPPYSVLAEELRARRACPAAMQEADAGLARAPDAGALLVVRGACREELGDAVGAEADLRRALDLDPDGEDVRFLLGTLLARSGKVAEALPLLREQAQMTPDRVEAVVALGLALYDSGQFDEAIPVLNPVVDGVGAGREAPLVLADALLQTGGDLDEALRLLDVAEARGPEEPQVHAVRARVLAAKGDREGAMVEAEKYKAEKYKAANGTR